MERENTPYWDKTRRQKKHEHQWERHMSIGIAAICAENGSGRIVGCMDRKVSTDSASAETEMKCNYIQEYDPSCGSGETGR